MKKQYFISLLGIAAISIPLGSGLSTFNLQQITPTYEDEELNTGITIDEENSSVKVLDNDHDGKVSAGDQFDEIYFKTSFKMPTSPKFQVVNPNETGLNIYEENEVYPKGDGTGEINNEAEALYSVRYSTLGSLNSGEEDGELIIDINSTNDPNLWIWSLLLRDDSTNLIVTAEGKKIIDGKVSGELIESGIGKVKVESSLFELEPKIEVTSINGEVLTTKDTASVYYRVTPGTDGDGKPLTFDTLEWFPEEENSPFTTSLASGDYLNEGLIIATDLETEGQATTSYNNTKLVATMSDGTSTEVEVNDFTTKGDPVFNEPSAINVDDKHGILEVQGSIISNGTTINSVNIVDIKENKIVGKQEINSNDPEIDYSVSTENYNGHLANYKLQMTYQVNGNIKDPIEKTIIDVEDEKGDLIQSKKLNKLGAGAVIAILIAVLLIVGIIIWAGNILYKKVKENKIDNDDSNSNNDNAESNIKIEEQNE